MCVDHGADVAPAIALASRGFIVSAALAQGAAEESAAMRGKTNFGRYFTLREGSRVAYRPTRAWIRWTAW